MWLRSEKTPISQHGGNEKFLRDAERWVGGWAGLGPEKVRSKAVIDFIGFQSVSWEI